MKLIIAISGLLLASGAAFAQNEQPEAVYQKLHRAALAASVDDLMQYTTAAKRAELKAMPGREATLKMQAGLMPKQYTVNSRTLNPDGKTARLIASGMGEMNGTFNMMYGTVNFLREDGKWLVDQWEWGSQKPAAFPVSQPAAAAASVPAAAAQTPAEQAAAAPKEMSRLERQEARKKAREEAEAKRLQAIKEKEEADRKAYEARFKNCVIKPVMSDDDLRKCGSDIKSN